MKPLVEWNVYYVTHIGRNIICFFFFLFFGYHVQCSIFIMSHFLGCILQFNWFQQHFWRKYIFFRLKWGIYLNMYQFVLHTRYANMQNANMGDMPERCSLWCAYILIAVFSSLKKKLMNTFYVCRLTFTVCHNHFMFANFMFFCSTNMTLAIYYIPFEYKIMFVRSIPSERINRSQPVSAPSIRFIIM